MGFLLYPVFNPEARLPVETTGEFLGRYFEELDDIAIDLDMIPLSAFGDNRPIPEGFDGPPWELDEVLGEWDEWYDTAEGLATAEGLTKAIEENADLQGRLSCPDEIVAELRELAKQLRHGKDLGSKFRLEFSYSWHSQQMHATACSRA